MHIARYISCRNFTLSSTLSSGERAKVGSWALYGALDTSGRLLDKLTVVRVVEFWQCIGSAARKQGKADKALAAGFSPAQHVLPTYRTHPLLPKGYGLLDPHLFVCLLNVQRNCLVNRCDASATRPVMQEREQTSETTARIRRHNPQGVMINVAQMRSARHLRAYRHPAPKANWAAHALRPTRMSFIGHRSGHLGRLEEFGRRGVYSGTLQWLSGPGQRRRT